MAIRSGMDRLAPARARGLAELCAAVWRVRRTIIRNDSCIQPVGL
jgi:hypothetical protein